MTDYKEQILEFWFEETTPEQWFQKSAAFDQKIIDRFEALYDKGAAGEFEDWRNSAHGALAYCILLDQMPRNMFRGTPKSFMTDGMALKMAQDVMAAGLDQDLPVSKRRFVYLPFEHSENLKHQEQSVALFEVMKDDDAMGYDYAIKHYDVIKEFGRFPHRNEILRRANTSEEKEYLSNPDAGF